MENIFKFPQQPNLYLYNRFKQRLKTTDVAPILQPLPFYFFGSGSSGNSVYLTRLHTLIDLGFPYSHYKELNPNFFLDVDYLILTHEHSDHLNVSTLFKILEMFPNVKILLSKRLYQVITNPLKDQNKIAKRMTGNFNQRIDDLTHTYKSRFEIIEHPQTTIPLVTRHQTEFWLTPHFVKHGSITNMAIEISTLKYDIHMLYASDLDHLLDPTGIDVINNRGLPSNYSSSLDPTDPQFNYPIDQLKFEPLKNPFNLMFLEANYDKEILDPILQKDPHNARALGNKRHISEQEAWKYASLSLSSTGLFVPLHASTTFGTLVQDLTKQGDINTRD